MIGHRGGCGDTRVGGRFHSLLKAVQHTGASWHKWGGSSKASVDSMDSIKVFLHLGGEIGGFATKECNEGEEFLSANGRGDTLASFASFV